MAQTPDNNPLAAVLAAARDEAEDVRRNAMVEVARRFLADEAARQLRDARATLAPAHRFPLLSRPTR